MQQRIRQYEILEEIASGGQATVYRARDSRSGRIVALKVMHRHLARDPNYIERFLREARMASSLNDPHVVRIFDYGQEEGTYFIAMEYVPSTLHHLLREEGQLPTARALAIASQTCQALEAAHRNGIIHRDIKPQNIMISEEGTVKVTDFGIARAVDLSTMTRTGMVLGTPHYISPEQAQGRRPDIRADLYSLGVVMYQMLTAELPFDADTPWEVMRQHLERKATPVRDLRRDIPGRVAAVVDRALAKDPDKRFQTPYQMREAISRLRIAEAPPKVDTPTQARAVPQAPPARPRPAAKVREVPVGAERPRRRGLRMRNLFAAVAVMTAIIIASVLLVRPTPVPRPLDDRLVAGVPAPFVSDTSPWPMFRCDAQHSGFNAGENSLAPPLELKWFYRTDGEVFSSPAVVKGVVYVGSDDGWMYALHWESGKLVWKYRTDAPITSSPAVAEGMVYFACDDGTLYALDAAKGERRWSQDIGAARRTEFCASPVVEGGTVYINSSDELVALDAASGRVLWKSGTRGPLASSPAAFKDRVYSGSQDGALFALDADGGKPIWREGCGSIRYCSPAVVDGKLYIGSDDGKLHCFDAATGKVIWGVDAEPGITTSPAVVFAETVYVGCGDKLCAFDAATGRYGWEHHIGSKILSSPAVANGVVYFGSEDGKLYAVDAHKGEVRWSYQATAPIFSSPAVANGMVFVATTEGEVLAFGPRGGPTIVTPTPVPVYEWRWFSPSSGKPYPASEYPALAEEIERRSGGRLKIRLSFAGEQPYKYGDIIKAVEAREAEVGDVLGGYAEPVLGVLDLPFLMPSAREAAAVYDAIAEKAFYPVYDRHNAREVATYFYAPLRLHAREPLNSWDAFQRNRISITGEASSMLLSALGGTLVQVPLPELHAALETGVIDAAVTTTTAAYTIKLYDFVKYITAADFSFPTASILVNKDAWRELPAELQKVVLDVFTEYEKKWREQVQALDGELTRKAVEEYGVKVVSLPESFEAELGEKAKNIWYEWANKHGGEASKVLEMAEEALATPPPSQPQYGGTLVVAGPDPQLSDWDPYGSVSAWQRYAASLIYSKLVTYPSGPGYGTHDFTPTPDLADDWEMSADGTEWKFHLRKGVRWHDGQPLTSEDVVYSFKHAQEAGWLQRLGLDAVIRDIDTPDPETVVFHLHQPFAPFLDVLATSHLPIIPAHAPNDIVGSGPFIFNHYQAGKEAWFVRNHDYFRPGLPYVDNIQWLIVPDESTRREMLKQGQVDLCLPFTTPDSVAAELKQANPDLAYFEIGGAFPYSLYFRADEPPFDDRWVRLAMRYAIDQQELIDACGAKDEKLGPIPASWFSGWATPPEELDDYSQYNPDLAKELLTEAGYPDGFETEINFTDAFGEQYIKMVEVIAAMLAKVNIDAKVILLDGGTYYGTTYAGDYHGIACARHSALEIDSYLYPQFHSAGGRNLSHVSDPTLDELLDYQRTTPDPRERQAIIRELEYYLAETVYSLPLPAPAYSALWQPWVEDFSPHAGYEVGRTLEQVWLAEKTAPPTPTPTLKSLTLSPSAATLKVEETQQLAALATYTDGSTKDVTAQATWASSNEGVAILNAAGLVKGVAAGSAKITATLEGVVSSTATLTVTAPEKPTYAGGGWTIQRQPNYGLEAIAFADARNGWAVGAYGTVLHTSDGGESWEWQDSGTTTRLEDVAFIDANRGWAVGHCTIIRTADGGGSWEVQQSETLGPLNSVVFVDASNGWVVGRNGTILHTSDGGESWEQQDSGTEEGLEDVDFVDASHGWAVGENGIVLRTTDGGSSWWRSSVGGLGPRLSAVTFIDAQRGWVVAEYQGFVFRTTNGGASWRRYTTEPPNYLMGVAFVDASNGWAVGHWGCISHTSDGGESWTSQHPESGEFLVDVAFVNSRKGWVVGEFGSILHTTDGGSTWVTQRDGGAHNLNGVSFVDANKGWAVGEGGLVLHTSNAGAQWQHQPIDRHIHLRDVAFADAQNGCAVSWEILYTRDGGRSWEQASADISEVHLYGVTLADGGRGWAVGAGGTILHTSDGGESWRAQSSGIAADLRDVAFVDARNGWVVGDGGTILHTADGGASWQTQSSGTGAWLNGVAFVDLNNGWVVADSGTILHTSDGGASWQTQDSGIWEHLEAVAFVDLNNGWAVGQGGIILHTSDGGASWQRQISYVDHWLLDVTFADAYHGWAVGEGGVILRYEARGIADSWELYVKTALHDYGAIPTPEDFGEYQGLVADAATLLWGLPGEYAVYGLRTWVYVDEAVTIPVVFSGDDSAGLYVNGQLVAATDSPWDRDYGEIHLAPGWSKIEALVYNTGTHCHLSFDKKIGDYVGKMRAQVPSATLSIARP